MDEKTKRFIRLPNHYKSLKNEYEKYFKKKIIVSEMDYFYALLIKFGCGNIFKIFKKLSKHFPNIFTKGVYNALTVFDADSIIFDDKIDKGIVVVHEIKDRYGERISINYEEIDGIYELVYGNDYDNDDNSDNDNSDSNEDIDDD